MTVKKVINWKLSELPVGTIIQGFGPKHQPSQFYKEEVTWTKGAFLLWSDFASGEYGNGLRDDEIDDWITDFEILSVPGEWYEEFREVPGSPWWVSRAGWAKIPKIRTGVIDASEVPDHFILVGSTAISLKTAVRKAFA